MIQLAKSQEELAAQKLRKECQLALEREDRLRQDFRNLAAPEAKAAVEQLEQQLHARAQTLIQGDPADHLLWQHRHQQLKFLPPLSNLKLLPIIT